MFLSLSRIRIQASKIVKLHPVQTTNFNETEKHSLNNFKAWLRKALICVLNWVRIQIQIFTRSVRN